MDLGISSLLLLINRYLFHRQLGGPQMFSHRMYSVVYLLWVILPFQLINCDVFSGIFLCLFSLPIELYVQFYGLPDI